MKKILLIMTLFVATLLSGCVVYPIGYGYGYGGGYSHHYGGGWRR